MYAATAHTHDRSSSQQLVIICSMTCLICTDQAELPRAQKRACRDRVGVKRFESGCELLVLACHRLSTAKHEHAPAVTVRRAVQNGRRQAAKQFIYCGVLALALALLLQLALLGSLLGFFGCRLCFFCSRLCLLFSLLCYCLRRLLCLLCYCLCRFFCLLGSRFCRLGSFFFFLSLLCLSTRTPLSLSRCLRGCCCFLPLLGGAAAALPPGRDECIFCCLRRIGRARRLTRWLFGRRWGVGLRAAVAWAPGARVVA